MKQLVTLPFGSSLSRGEGAFIVQPSTMSDLRNVRLGAGRVRVRRGLTADGAIAGATDILAVSPLRGTARSLVVAYSDVTREAWLVTAIIDPATQAVTLTPVTGGTLWTLPVQAGFPRVSVTDSFGIAFIAHDEPSFALRQPTKVYNAAAGTLADLTLKDETDPVRFRGVGRHLQYVVGWGYGFPESGPPDERDRGEVFRLSIPGDPLTWEAQYYLLLGQRGEQLVAGGALPAGYVAGKTSELHLVVGANPATFDSRVIDPFFGPVSAAAGLVVGDAYWFWSSEGPRVTTGGESRALGVTQLDLLGAVPDDLLRQTDYRSCFALYRPETNEIEWCFPVAGRNATWSFVLHLDPSPDGSQRWSYRPYSAVLRCAGLLSGNIAITSGDPLNFPYPVPATLTLQAGSFYQWLVQWTNTNADFLPSGSVAEVWAAGGATESSVADAMPWTKVGETAVVTGSQSLTVTIGTPRTVQPSRLVAIRYRLPDGSYYPAYASSNPFDWPSNARLATTNANRPAILGAALAATSPADGTSVATWSQEFTANLDAGSEVEVWGMGAIGLGGTPVAPDTWQLEAVVPATAEFPATQDATALDIGQRWKHVALRLRIAGFTGDNRYYAEDVSPTDPSLWPAGQRAAYGVALPVPVLQFGWDTTSGIQRSPGVLSVSFPDAPLLAAATYRVSVYVIPRLLTETLYFSLAGKVPVFQQEYAALPTALPPLVVDSLSSSYEFCCVVFVERLTPPPVGYVPELPSGTSATLPFGSDASQSPFRAWGNPDVAGAGVAREYLLRVPSL